MVPSQTHFCCATMGTPVSILFMDGREGGGGRKEGRKEEERKERKEIGRKVGRQRNRKRRKKGGRKGKKKKNINLFP